MLLAVNKVVAGVASIAFGGRVTNRPGRFIGMLHVAGLSGIVDLLTPCLVVLLQAIF